MPGVTLSFNCPCGFNKNDITVGVSDTGVHYEVFLCLQCKNIISIARSSGQYLNQTCKKCEMKLMAVTDPGAWMPASLQQRFTDSEPWMIYDQVVELEQPEDDQIALIKDIRILCPYCGKYSLEFNQTGCWD